MQKYSYFASQRLYKWPSLKLIEPYFLAPPGTEWFSHGKGANDSGGFSLQGVDSTHDLPYGQGRVDINLNLWGCPGLGVLLIYEKIGGPDDFHFVSKGDLSRRGEYVRSTHDTPLPVAHFVPFAEAWEAVKEFMATEGQLPKSIEWVAGEDLPDNTFPDP
ncbi:MAG: Imm1 family immunity protein [Hyphomicrobiaceae bacterium]